MNLDARESKDNYFMSLAKAVATRSTCNRKLVGAVIVSQAGHILSTGYNGSIAGTEHCNDNNHLMENGHCIRTIHAEANAIIQAAINGTSIKGASIYVTASPCWTCFKMLANAGVTRICFGEFYRDQRSLEIASQLGIEMIDLSTPGNFSSQEQKPVC